MTRGTVTIIYNIYIYNGSKSRTNEKFQPLSAAYMETLTLFVKRRSNCCTMKISRQARKEGLPNLIPDCGANPELSVYTTGTHKFILPLLTKRTVSTDYRNLKELTQWD